MSRKSKTESKTEPNAEPKTKRARRPKADSTTGPWRLFRESLTDLRGSWKRLFWVMAVVLIPLNVIGLIPSVASDPGASVVAYGAIILLNVALLWAIVQYKRTGHVPGPGTAYYDGSEAIIRTLITVFWLTIMMIPALISTVLILIAGTVAEISGSPWSETLLIDLVLVLLAIPTIWLTVRFGLAPVAAVADGLRPWPALRYARQLTLGRFWRTLATYGALLVFVVLLALPITAITAGLALVKVGALAGFFFGLVTTFFILPLTFFFLLGMYRSLQTPSVVTSEPVHPHPAPVKP
jgi:hypothetical protein